MKHREPVRRNLVGSSRKQSRAVGGAVAGAATDRAPYVLGRPGHVPPGEDGARRHRNGRRASGTSRISSRCRSSVTPFATSTRRWRLPVHRLEHVQGAENGGRKLAVPLTTSTPNEAVGQYPAARLQRLPRTVGQRADRCGDGATPSHPRGDRHGRTGWQTRLPAPLTIRGGGAQAEAARRGLPPISNAGQASEEARFVQVSSTTPSARCEIQVGIGPFFQPYPHARPPAKTPPCRLALIGTCGGPLPSDRIIQPIVLGPGATGGISGRGWSATSAATCSRLPSKP